MSAVYIILCILIVLPLLAIFLVKHKPDETAVHTLFSGDALKGVLNATTTKDTLKQYVKQTQKPIAVFLIAIDRYQGLRTHFPNSMVDKIEQQVLNKLERILDKKQIAGVIGMLKPNEYCLILTDVNGQDAETLSANMCQSINEQKFTAEGRSVSISLSIGTVHSSNHHPSALDMISEADFLLQEAQSRGRSYFEYANMSGMSE